MQRKLAQLMGHLVTKQEWLEFWKLSGEEGELAWQAKIKMHENPVKAHHIISEERNYKPYKSMVTGEMIEGKRQHREHLKRHNLTEIGNEKIAPKPKQLPSGLKERLWEVARSKGF